MARLISLLVFPQELLEMLLRYCPGTVGIGLRRLYWKLRLGALGRQVRIETGVYFNGPRHIFIGDNCLIDQGVIFIAGVAKNDERIRKRISQPAFLFSEGEIRLGRDIHIAPYVILNGIAGIAIGDASSVGAHACLYSLSHVSTTGRSGLEKKKYLFSNRVAAEMQSITAGAIVIETQAGVGMHASLLPGTHVLQGAFANANSVVRGEISPM